MAQANIARAPKRSRYLRTQRRYEDRLKEALVIQTADATYEFSGEVSGVRTMHRVGESTIYRVRALAAAVGEPMTVEYLVARDLYKRLESAQIVSITPDPARQDR